MLNGLAPERMTIALYRAFGAGLAITLMEMLARLADEPLARVPFVTSIVLVTALPDSEAAKARAIIGGHALASIAGWLSHVLMGPSEMASSVAVALAALGMIATRTLHPPAGIDAFLIPSQNLSWDWIVSPVLTGALLLAGFAKLWAAGERHLLRRAERF
jgi:CBS-domain-containing membrane protein